MKIDFNILLGSKSPRRKEILEKAGFDFRIVEIDVEESYNAKLQTDHIAEYLAVKKSKAYSIEGENDLLITSDTVVALSNEILEKPLNVNHAFEMLKKLSGKEHQVHSGVCLRSMKKTKSFTDTSIVKFRDLNDEEIKFYIENYKPFDKAGSYGVQDWLGMVGVDYIRGSFYTVMGLPIHKVYSELLKF